MNMNKDREVQATNVEKSVWGPASGWGVMIGVALAFYGLYSIVLLVKGLIWGEVSVRFDFLDSGVSSLDLGGTSASLSGITEVTVPTAALSPEAMTFLIIAKLVFALTLIGSAIVLVPVIKGISKGDPFTDRSLKTFSILSWVVSIGFVIFVIATVLGSNLASRDLGIADEVGASTSLAQLYLYLGISGGIELLRRSFVSGRRAQEELEGLV
ncbi:hypothetical protein [Brevibacterium metallidurans]|uniref:DUF2975 domain-containing protein n=1 Tax=Brevibacterium metallidurans TaxID=1482676 RepID=A0ABP3C9S2_9MICO